MKNFYDLTFTSSVLAQQEARGSSGVYGAHAVDGPAPAGLGPEEQEFLGTRDSFYMASVGENGWPYVQHRGGPIGFVHVLDDTHISWWERAGNRQYLTAGNLSHDDRVAIIAVDYPTRRRLKLLGHARLEQETSPERLARVGSAPGRVEGLVTVEVVAFDWNCPKFITPRYTADDVRAVTDALTKRIDELERELAARRVAGGEPV